MKLSLSNDEVNLIEEFSAIAADAFTGVFSEYEWFRIHQGGCYSSGDRFDVEEAVKEHQQKILKDLKLQLPTYLADSEQKRCIYEALRFVSEHCTKGISSGEVTKVTSQNEDIESSYTALIEASFGVEDVATLTRFNSTGREDDLLEIVNRLIRVTCWFHTYRDAVKPKAIVTP